MLALDPRELLGFHARAEPAGDLDSVFRVLSKGRSQLRPVRRFQQVGPQRGCADRVCLLDDQVLLLKEPRPRGGEAERQEETQQTEKGSLDGPDLPGGTGVGVSGYSLAQAETDFESDQENDEQRGTGAEVLENLDHDGLPSVP